MNSESEEARLTAYALGELPAAEIPEIEARLATSAEARQEVEEIRRLAESLTRSFAQELSESSVGGSMAPETTTSGGDEGSGTEVGPIDPVVEAGPRIVAFPGASRPRLRWVSLGIAAGLLLLTAVWWLPSGGRWDGGTQIAAKKTEAPPSLLIPLAPPPDVVITTGPARPPATPAPQEPSSVGMSPQLMNRYGLRPAPQADGESAAPRSTRDEGILLAQTAPGNRTMSPELRSRYGLGPAASDRSIVSPSSAPSPTSDAYSPNRERLARSGLSTDAALSFRPESRRLTTLSERLVDEPTPVGANPGYVDAGDNRFQSPLDEPLSTFGLDVDTGSYANVRRFLKAGMFPPRAAVRVEEMLNYFPYNYPLPKGDDVFGVQAEMAPCPWEPRHRLVRIAIRARGLTGERPPANLVFLVDVSGSMQPGDRLPLLKQGLRALVRHLAPSDRVAIVTYASSAGVRLPSTSVEEKDRILEAIDSLDAGGSTNGEGGIRQAYAVARSHLIPGGVNRVLLCTDGDFNVGISDQNELVALVEQEARSGVFLTALGVGTDNFKDALMRQVADRGNGSYHYLDSFEEAQRVLLEQRDATFVTVARDAKAQVEFNPGNVAAWRLVGYEKRLMANQDFNDDTKDAGEIGAGQSVTVLYEIVPAGERVPGNVDGLKYQPVVEEARPARKFARGPELLTVKLRYQRPEGSRSVLKELALPDREGALEGDFRFSAAVASFGMALRDPRWHQGRGFDLALELASRSLGEDPGGWRAEFLTLVRKARGMPRRSATGFE